MLWRNKYDDDYVDNIDDDHEMQMELQQWSCRQQRSILLKTK